MALRFSQLHPDPGCTANATPLDGLALATPIGCGGGREDPIVYGGKVTVRGVALIVVGLTTGNVKLTWPLAPVAANVIEH